MIRATETKGLDTMDKNKIYTAEMAARKIC